MGHDPERGSLRDGGAAARNGLECGAGAAPQSMRSEGPPRPTTGFRDPPGTRRPPRHGPPGRVRPGEFAAVTAHDAPFAGVRTAADPRGAQNGVRTRSSGAARGREQGLGRHRATLSRPAVRGFGDGTAAYLAEVPGARTVRSTLRTCRSRSPTAPRAGRLRHHPPRGSPPEGQGRPHPKRSVAGPPAFAAEPDPGRDPAARPAACVETGADRIGVAFASEPAPAGGGGRACAPFPASAGPTAADDFRNGSAGFPVRESPENPERVHGPIPWGRIRARPETEPSPDPPFRKQ